MLVLASGPNARERALAAENEELKAALGEAHVELRVWKKSAEGTGRGLRGARGDPPRGRDADDAFRAADRCAGAFVQTLAAA